uniref:Reverse transcriptase Ty1/copia-type domain-containing protein n=1 Tax=Lactuca sativa TaxID=4236 RepID=A0A9R1XM98_LACSA|nr:hypothetical protein LSAT_V11C300139010 [Lactuca sativa]
MVMCYNPPNHQVHGFRAEPLLTDSSPSSSFTSTPSIEFKHVIVEREPPVSVCTPQILKESCLTKWTKGHPAEQIKGDMDSRVVTRSATKNDYLYASLISMIVLKGIKEVLQLADWVKAMQEELVKFERNNMWDLVPTLEGVSVVGSRWVYRNKSDEDGVIIKNKAILVVKAYLQQEGIDCDETLAPIARIEAIRIFLTFVAHKNFKVYQMDVQCTLLNGEIDKDVYVQQPPGFKDPKFPNHFYKLQKDVYGFKQAPRLQISSFWDCCHELLCYQLSNIRSSTIHCILRDSSGPVMLGPTLLGPAPSNDTPTSLETFFVAVCWIRGPEGSGRDNTDTGDASRYQLGELSLLISTEYHVSFVSSEGSSSKEVGGSCRGIMVI